ncbi:copper resistance D domain-containing protein [Cupriavidus basilensis OR16]|uniref:Copper resistance D domain-containing protein n=1 Tax=Cupriavidus basilensis OR16 TaxID=1127483 RepID=H1S2K9_9BURK|nr:CopD family protein [Cupriavidus basilensis]EHP43257.1 copper resistance D domain-containing protein [Cupriavidus basilensis OR16]
MNDGFLGVARLALTALQNLGFAVLVGTLLSDRWLARSPSPWQARMSQHLARGFRVGAIVALLSGGLAFWIHCALMSESSLVDAGPAVRSMLMDTGFGHAWAVGAALMLCVTIAAFFRWTGRGRGFKSSLWLALAGFALSRSHAGHPVDAGAFSLPVWVDWVHLLAVSAWVGIVCVAAFMVAPRMAEAPEGDRRNGASFIQSLSDTATCALVALFVTGAYGGWHGVGSPGKLLDSTYGRLLVLKLGLVLVAVTLGGHNRFRGAGGQSVARYVLRCANLSGRQRPWVP